MKRNMRAAAAKIKTGKQEESYDSISIERREKVKDAMLHAWTSYEKYAWGKDELQVFPQHINHS